MGEPQSLRYQDARAVFQLLGECLEQWDDVDAWRSHLMQGAVRLLKTRTAHWVATDMVAQRGESIASWGWENAVESQAYAATLDEPLDSVMPGTLKFIASQIAEGFVTFRIRDVLSESQWRNSRGYNEFLRQANCDAAMLSNRLAPATKVIECLGVSRVPGDKSFTVRERLLLEHLHRELAPLIGKRLATEEQIGRRELTRRQRQTLDGLLQGHTERRIAHQLGISPTTVHDYVQSLYRHFDLHSRRELMSYFIARIPRNRSQKPVKDRRESEKRGREPNME